MEKANVLAALNDARDALDALISNEKTIEAVVAAAGLIAATAAVSATPCILRRR